jgi:hypothetical protein
MRGIFWNVRGLNQPRRSLNVQQLIRYNRVDFIGIQEIKKEVLHPSFLNNLSSPISFTWHFLPAVGTAGGILIGFRDDTLLVSNIILYRFSVSCMVQCRKNSFDWKLVVVYGSPYDEGKVEFIDELHLVLAAW